MLCDLRIAVRALRSWRLGALAAVLTLAVGIGTTTSLYTLLRTALDSGATRIEDFERLGRVYASEPTAPSERTPIRAADFDLLSAARSFESIAAWTRTQMVVGRGVTDDTVSVTCVSAQYFSVLGARALAGRLFVAADFDGMAPVALVNDRLWWQPFAGRSLDDDVTITLNGTPRRVVGVIPAEFEFSFIGIGGDPWIPMTGAEKRANGPVSVIARLKPEHTWTAAAAELEALTPATGRSAASRWHVIPVEQDSRFRTTSATAAMLLPALVVLGGLLRNLGDHWNRRSRLRRRTPVRRHRRPLASARSAWLHRHRAAWRQGHLMSCGGRDGPLPRSRNAAACARSRSDGIPVPAPVAGRTAESLRAVHRPGHRRRCSRDSSVGIHYAHTRTKGDSL
jgi:hypothetical protein